MATDGGATDHLHSPHQQILLVTGPSGAGRSTAVRVLEDLGFEVIDNLPLSLLDRLLDGPAPDRPLALGLDVRNRDFTVEALIHSIDRLTALSHVDVSVLYLDASADELVKRYSETRRRHPLSPDEHPLSGIESEISLLAPIKARADYLIETSEMSPHDLRAAITQLLLPDSGKLMSISVQSFSYKRGLPRGGDIVLDCRFLRNPHWDEALRHLTGQSPEVADYITADPAFAEFYDSLLQMLRPLLPAYAKAGRSHLAVAFGCTGGQHRSVACAEILAKALAEEGWQVSKRHRELERRASVTRPNPEA